MPPAPTTISSAAEPSAKQTRSLLPRRISPTSIARYRTCPRSVWFQLVAKEPRRERPSPNLMLGNAVHVTLDKFFGLHPDQRKPHAEVLQRCLRSVWPEHRKPDTFVTVDEERDWGETGLRQLIQFAERFDCERMPVARERWVSTRLANGVEPYGKVDRIDGCLRETERGQLEVVDYKTGRWVIDPGDLRDEPAAQVYLLATEDEYAREVARVRYVYLDAGAEVTWEPEREDVELAREQLLAVTWQMYTDREFEARPGPQCGRCPFAHVCPDAGRVELGDLEVADDVVF